MLQQPLRVVLEEMPVADDVKAALLGFDNRVRHVLECATSYERGDWSTCLDLAALLGLDARALAPAYLDALRSAQDLTHQP
jgi:EAL and modified HD-GYP domain-containing signal transduction protein